MNIIFYLHSKQLKKAVINQYVFQLFLIGYLYSQENPEESKFCIYLNKLMQFGLLETDHVSLSP